MYNLIVGFSEDTAIASRMLEYTDAAIKKYVAPAGTPDAARLLNLPTLVMPEVGSDSRQVARVGHLEHLTPIGSDYRFHFVSTLAIPEIPLAALEAEASALGINMWEFRRTHWAVKDVDLHHVLHALLTPTPTPTVFKLPREAHQENLVAVMMPFDPKYNAVYGVLQEAASAANLQCQRVDDI